MNTEDLQDIRDLRNLRTVVDVLAESDWPMKLVQIANNCRLSVKTVSGVISDNPQRFICKDEKYSLKELAVKPSTQSVSVSGFEFGNIGAMTPTQEEKADNTPLTHILGIPLTAQEAKPKAKPKAKPEAKLEVEPEISPITEEDKHILVKMLTIIKNKPSGYMSRDLMMILNIRRDQVYKYTEILIAKSLIHKQAAKSNRNNLYRYGASSDSPSTLIDFSDMVVTTNTQHRQVVLNQEQLELVLLQLFNMETIDIDHDDENGITVQLTSEVIF